MNQYLRKYKAFLIFLGKFFSTYVLLTLVYQYYLSHFDETMFETDGFTNLVADHVEHLLFFANADASAVAHESQPTIKLYYNNQYVARIIEGCNAVSVMILFTAFVIAFTGKWKHTIGFIIGGILMIHLLNIIRIALLTAALYHFPEQEHLLHGVVFPLFIYGVVFILWVIWVNKFSLYAKKDLAD